jgi:microsomal epoxide hydrolase
MHTQTLIAERRSEEDFINSFPQFKTIVTDDDGSKHEIHFMALLSEKKDAIPIAFFHGWPGTHTRKPLVNVAY